MQDQVKKRFQNVNGKIKSINDLVGQQMITMEQQLNLTKKENSDVIGNALLMLTKHNSGRKGTLIILMNF